MLEAQQRQFRSVADSPRLQKKKKAENSLKNYSTKKRVELPVVAWQASAYLTSKSKIIFASYSSEASCRCLSFDLVTIERLQHVSGCSPFNLRASSHIILLLLDVIIIIIIVITITAI